MILCLCGRCIWYCRCSAAAAYPGVCFDPSVKGWGNSAGVGIKVMIIPRWSTLKSLFPYTFPGGPLIGFVLPCGLTGWFVWVCMLVFGFPFLMPLKFRAENVNWVDLQWSPVRLRNTCSTCIIKGHELITIFELIGTHGI